VKTAYRGGGSWQARDASFVEDMQEVWGDWGVSTEYGTLRSVLVRRPGPEVDGIENAEKVLWIDLMDGDVARQQHDAMVEAYRAHGVAVHYVENARLDKPNSHFVRDLLLMTPEGAIITRPASRMRAGEERYVAEALGRLGVPILMTIHGEATFEGADVALVAPGVAFVAEGARTNKAGADQVEWALRQVGYDDIIRLQTAYGTVHLDGVLSVVDRDVALVRFRETPLAAVRALHELGFRTIAVPPEDNHMPGNIVALAPGKLLLPAGNPVTKGLLEDAGCEVIEVDVSEIIKSGGAIHCMTGFLRREEP